MIITVHTLIFFRESLISAIDRFFRPFFTKISLFLEDDSDDDDDDDVDSRGHGRGHGHGRRVGLFTIKNVFAEYDDEKGLVFYPPVYAQRYAVVIDCLLDQRWYEKLEKVVDFGYHDMSFIRYLKDVSGINNILGVDIETIPAQCSYDLLECDNNAPKRESPVSITLLQGNAADPDYRLIGCDAVIAIELIEHMLPHDLERFVHTVFGFIKPWIAVITTPNSDFNVLFKALEKNGLRRLDHYFEWSREQFHDWCSNIVTRYPQYTVTSKGIGPGPPGTWHLGSCSQLALFVSKDYQKQPDLCLNSLSMLSKAPPKCEMFEDNWTKPTRTFSDPTLCKRDKLNCTAMGKNKFFKGTLGLMAKYTIDQIVRARKAIDEIKRLVQILDLNTDRTKETSQGNHIWYNINWGENAPYWNQYYKVFKEYVYPSDMNPEESRILDAIVDEINIFVERGEYGELSLITKKFEIPLDRILKSVEHITNDVDKVKDILEWNGFDIEGDLVIYTHVMDDDDTSSDKQEEDSSHDTPPDVINHFEIVN